MTKMCNENWKNFALAIFLLLSIISQIESHPLTETGNMPLVSVLTEAYGEGTPGSGPSGILIAPKDQPQAFSSPGTIGREETNEKRRFSLFGYNFGGDDSYDEASSFYPGGGDYPYSGPGGSYPGAGNPYSGPGNSYPGSFDGAGGSYFDQGAGGGYGGNMYPPSYGGQSYGGSSNYGGQYGGSYGQQGPSGYPQSSYF